MNDFLKNVKQVWNGIPANRRIPILVTALFIIVGLTTVIAYTNKPKMAVLFGGMQPAEASKVVDFLKEKKVRYELGSQGQTVLVPEASVYDMRLALAAAGIPRASDTEGGVGFELFDKPSFGISDFMQKANYTRALQGELARTISKMADIESARVMLVTPEERLFSKDRREARASVFIQLKSGHALGPDGVSAIRFLVSNSVEGLQPNHVVVVDSAGRSLTPDDAGNGIGALTNTQLTAQREYEQHLKENVQSMLDQTLGVNQAHVEISAQLNFDTVQQTSETYDPKSAVVGSETTSTESTHSKTQAAEAATGSTTNTSESQDSGKNTTSSDTSKESAQNQYNMNRIVESLSKAMGVPTQVTAAVVVNVRKTGVGTNESVKPRTPQEIKQLEDMVKQAIGFTQNKNRNDSVSVSEMEFPSLAETEEAAPVEKTVLGLKDQYLPWIGQGCLILLAGFVLLYLRSILKSSSSFESDASGEFSSLLNRYKKMADDALAEADREKAAPTALTVDELSKLIRDNPGNTSQAIKVWMMRN